MKFALITAVVLLGLPVPAQAGIFGSHVVAMSEPVDSDQLLFCKKQDPPRVKGAALLSCLSKQDKQQAKADQTSDLDS